MTVKSPPCHPWERMPGRQVTALYFPYCLQRELTQTAQEQKELLEKLQEETEQKEQLRKLKNEMESERWHLDKTIEKLQKEVRGREVEQGSSWPRRFQALSPGKALETLSSPKYRCTWALLKPCSHSLDLLKIPDAEKLV